MGRTTLFWIPLITLLALLVIATPALAECADTDPADDIYVKGTVTLADGTVYTDGCPTSFMSINVVGQEVPRTPAEKVAEFFCDDGTVTSGGDVSCSGGVCARQVTCPGIGVCTDGACVAGEPYCTDTDGGRNSAVKGEVTSSSPLPNSPLNIDYCSYGSPGGDRLFEYYCEGVAAPAGGGTDIRMIWDSHAAAAGYVDAIWVEEYVCPVRCYDGACVAEACPAVAEPTCPQGTSLKKVLDSNGCTAFECVPTTTLCADTDGGREYVSKGTVTYDGRTFADRCDSDTALREYYCDGGIMRPETYTCPGGCKDGACVGTGSATSCPSIPEAPPCPSSSSMKKVLDSKGCVIGFSCEAPSTQPVRECAQEGKLCAGIAGIQCCEGLTCSMDSRADYPDASGTCVRLPDDRIPCWTGLSEGACERSGGTYISCPSMCQEKPTQTVSTAQTVSAEALAKCLAEKGAVAYIASSCPYCEKLAGLFGDSWSAIKKVECRFLDATGGEDCAAKGIIGYPTWMFADGSSLTGVTSLNDIAMKASCPLPESSTGTAAVSCIKVCGQPYCQCERDKVYCEDDPYNSECVCRSGERSVISEGPECTDTTHPCPLYATRPRFSCVEGHEQDIVKARLNEIFKLAAPQAAIIVDYNDMQVKLTALDYGRRIVQPISTSEATAGGSAVSSVATASGGAGSGVSSATGQVVEEAESMRPIGYHIVAHLVVTMPGSRKLVLAQQNTRSEIASITGRIVGVEPAATATTTAASVATEAIAPSAVQVLKLRQGESASVFGVTLTVKELTKGSGVFVVSRGEGVVCPESKTCEDGTVLKCWQEGDGCGCESCPDVIRCKSTFCPDGSEVGCSWDGQACACKPCPVEQRPVCGNGICEDGEGMMCRQVGKAITATPSQPVASTSPTHEKVCYVACPEDCGKETPSECDGCLADLRCLPYGARRIVEDASVYCDFEGQWNKQLPDEEKCQNDYECATNSCKSGKCADLEKEIAGLRATVQKLLDFIGRIFG